MGAHPLDGTSDPGPPTPSPPTHVSLPSALVPAGLESAAPTPSLLAMFVMETSGVTTLVASSPHLPRSASYSKRGRLASTPMKTSRCSDWVDASRPADSPALPIPEQEELRAAARNLEIGTPSPLPVLQIAPSLLLSRFRWASLLRW